MTPDPMPSCGSDSGSLVFTPSTASIVTTAGLTRAAAWVTAEVWSTGPIAAAEPPLPPVAPVDIAGEDVGTPEP